jgi:hypothetical protein
VNDEDARHLELLTIFHYVVGAIFALFGFMPIFHIVIGIGMVTGTMDMFEGRDRPPDFFGYFFIAGGIFMMAMMWALAAAVFMVAWCLKNRRSYIFCLVVAGFECFFAPFGTVLGVFTILVLSRPSVKALFGVASPSAST